MAYLIDTDTIIFALRKDKLVIAKLEENKNIPFQFQWLLMQSFFLEQNALKIIKRIW